jgi:hypothetical protein
MAAIVNKDNFKLSFTNQHTVYENYITAKIKENEYNLTYNPSLRDISVKKAEYEYKAGRIDKEEYEEIKLLAEYAGGYLKDPNPGLYE